MAKDALGRPHTPTAAGVSPVSWPALAFESAHWPVYADSGMSKRQAQLNRGEYEAAVVPRIAEAALWLPADLAADLDEATMALVRLDERSDSVLGLDAELAPMRSILLRTESASSSQIEGITASARKLALAELGEHSEHNAELVQANVHAMEAALDLSDEPGTESILEMHAALMRAQPRHTPGEFRREQVWIGGLGPRTASFVPPLPERVDVDMADLAAFIRRNDLPPLAQATIAHAQFETIHPFTDGNGRTGRALVHAMLRRAGTTRRVATPISAGILTDPDNYFGSLSAYRRGDARPVLETFARAKRACSAPAWSTISRPPARKCGAGLRLAPTLPRGG